MSAKEMFEKLGLEYNECKYQGEVEEISYINKYNYSTKVKFDLKNKRFIAYYGADSAGNIDMELLQAINKQVEELGWYEYEVEILEEEKKDNFTGWKMYQDGKEVCSMDCSVEEKKIPERLNKNYYITHSDINQPSKVSYDLEQLLEMVQDIYEKQGEICDYLNSKGE